MVTVETRPLQDSERETLSRIVTGAENRAGAFAAGLTTFLFVSSVALLVWPWDRGARSLVPALLALVAAFFVHRRTRASNSRRGETCTLRDELELGHAQVITYEVADAIAIDEREDEGSQYFLKLRDEQVLFVAGQHLYEFEEDTRFPTTKFQVVKTPRTGRLLAFNCLGAYLPPSSRRGPFSLVDYQSGHVPKDGDLWRGDFDALRYRGGSDG